MTKRLSTKSSLHNLTIMANRINLSIPQPCAENWNSMTPTQKGKFCGSCQKEVIDFSDMRDSELIAFFKRPAGSMCGRFSKEQLARDIIAPPKRIPFLKYFFGFALPAFLLSLKSSAQGERTLGRVVSISAQQPVKEKIQEPPVALRKEEVIRGKVRDMNGNAIPFATVWIKGTNEGSVCDSIGNFVISTSMPLPLTLTISCVGFMSMDKIVSSAEATTIELAMEMALTGEVVVVGMVRPKSFKTLPLIKEFLSTPSSSFRVYPNPVKKGGSINIQYKKMEKGQYVIKITDRAAQTVFSAERSINHKSGLFELDMHNELITGFYVVTITNKKSGETYSEKIIVE